MGLLIRMLEKQKWEKVDLTEIGHSKTPADTITSDLRTMSNTLSLWLIENREDILKGVLALAVGRNKITRLDVMILDQQDFEAINLEIKHTPENGHTPLEGFNDYHYDLINMDYHKLGILSQLIIDNLSDSEKCIRFDKAKIIDILYQGYVDKIFQLDELNDSLQQDFKKALIKLEKRRQSQ